ncbi:hypothetical protein ABRP83_13845 [Pectobacterium brasiliense]|uniref:hypothetical protein n=1 Tax=Pectobacterium brasiliense TaxID=180957 RepID=UPI0032EBC95D
MNTQNVKTATQEPSERCGLKTMLMHVLGRAAYSVCCDEEANLHYGDPFTRMDRVKSWLSGALAAIKSVIASKFAGDERFKPLDIVEQARQLCSVIVIESESGNSFQFYGHATLSEQWYPLSDGADINQEIERVAALNQEVVEVLSIQWVKPTVSNEDESLAVYVKSIKPPVRNIFHRITVSESGELLASSDEHRERIQNMPADVYAEMRSALACNIDFPNKFKLMRGMLRGIENGYYEQVSLGAIDIIRRTACLSDGLSEDLQGYIQNAINLAPDYHGRDLDVERINACIQNGDFDLAEIIAFKMYSTCKSRRTSPIISN